MENAIRKFQSMIRILMKTQGQDLIEYLLLGSLVALAATAGMRSLATGINTAFNNSGTKLTSYVTNGGGAGNNQGNNQGNDQGNNRGNNRG